MVEKVAIPTRRSTGHVGLIFSDGFTLARFPQGEGMPRLGFVFTTLVRGNTSPKYSDDARLNRQIAIIEAGLESYRIVRMVPIPRAEDLKRLITIARVGERVGEDDSVDCDGLMTDQLGVVIELRPADCHQILLDAGCAFALLHGGKTELRRNVVEIGVLALCETFGVMPEQIALIDGPGIGPCCYKEQDKFSIDLRAMIEEQARGIGISNILFATNCTCCSRDPRDEKTRIFPSHWRQPGIRFSAFAGPLL